MAVTPLASGPVMRRSNSPIGLAGRPSFASVVAANSSAVASDFARMGGEKQRLAGVDERAAPRQMTKHQADQIGAAAVRDHAAKMVAVLQMPHFMRQHAEYFVLILGFVEKARQQIDLAARQGEGVGRFRRQNDDRRGQAQIRGALEPRR